MESGGDRVHSSVKAIQDLEAAYARFSRALVEQLPEVARELTHVTEALQDRCRNLGNEISDLKDRISSADEDDDVSWEHDRLREAEDELSSAQTRTRRLSETASAYNKQAHQITQIATHDWAEAREFLRGASDDLLAYLALQVRPESLNGSRSEPSATRVPEESDLTKSMKAQEALLAARFDTEKLVVLDANGKLLFERVGGRSHVDIYPGDEPLLKNALVTHNHPSGRSFSHADIKTAQQFDLAELRAVGVAQPYTYVLKRPADGWATNMSSRHDTIYAETEEDLSLSVLHGEMTNEVAGQQLAHEALLRLAAEFGLEYEQITRTA